KAHSFGTEQGLTILIGDESLPPNVGFNNECVPTVRVKNGASEEEIHQLLFTRALTQLGRLPNRVAVLLVFGQKLRLYTASSFVWFVSDLANAIEAFMGKRCPQTSSIAGISVIPVLPPFVRSTIDDRTRNRILQVREMYNQLTTVVEESARELFSLTNIWARVSSPDKKEKIKVEDDFSDIRFPAGRGLRITTQRLTRGLGNEIPDLATCEGGSCSSVVDSVNLKLFLNSIGNLLERIGFPFPPCNQISAAIIAAGLCQTERERSNLAGDLGNPNEDCVKKITFLGESMGFRIATNIQRICSDRFQIDAKRLTGSGDFEAHISDLEKSLSEIDEGCDLVIYMGGGSTFLNVAHEFKVEIKEGIPHYLGQISVADNEITDIRVDIILSKLNKVSHNKKVVFISPQPRMWGGSCCDRWSHLVQNFCSDTLNQRLRDLPVFMRRREGHNISIVSLEQMLPPCFMNGTLSNRDRIHFNNSTIRSLSLRISTILQDPNQIQPDYTGTIPSHISFTRWHEAYLQSNGDFLHDVDYVPPPDLEPPARPGTGPRGGGDSAGNFRHGGRSRGGQGPRGSGGGRRGGSGDRASPHRGHRGRSRGPYRGGKNQGWRGQNRRGGGGWR
ncbi:MAG: hypothetical protein AAGJ80_02860, partial [Cyanobacteria bacterium J06553_1]